MLEALSALLCELKANRSVSARKPISGERTFFVSGRLPSYNWTFHPTLVACEQPANSVSDMFRKKFGNDRFRIARAEDQIRSVARNRIEWESKPGANVMQMTMAALGVLSSEEEKISVESSSRNESLRFTCNSGACLNVALSKNGGAVFTAFGGHNSFPEKAAVESIATDLENNVRSYSYSSGGEVMFGNGDMNSLFQNFFGHSDSLFDAFPHEQRRFEESPPSRPQFQRLENNQSSAVSSLESMGVQVIIPKQESSSSKVDWSSLAGYDRVKSQVEESVILGLKHPSLFEKIVAKTRQLGGGPGGNRPKVVLFEGPPGTGKSSTARIIAHETNVPMVHVPLESVVSKWFGESEKQIAKIYDLAREIAKEHGSSSVILFIDEIDSLVSSRDIGTPHEASKRILSVMLRQIDNGGFGDGDSPQCTLICATNRKKDLDKAFLSRVDSSIHFGLPSEDCRSKILKLYANHLSENELEKIASITDGLSGRNLKDLCQAAERRWAAHLLRRGLESQVSPPPVDIYIEAAKEKFSQQIS
jgi:SpoVK/Ycf46/Vps4 family AAA+-type ATPase